ncbi:hypothetical protein FVE85_1551 [Porphyridium purpureum]|uniref:Uncharacterized protein n=1 Tax=Porphyridium purpureum TaxID=35688 RepID=A0A5J4YVK1_PORPP|nr:hypothetical protein FVE85_1551 [Porphyridium purpureum]|eukprot:POR5663..scf209_3
MAAKHVPPENDRANLAAGVKKKWADKTLRELCRCPLAALSGVPQSVENYFRDQQVRTVEELAAWKYAEIASGLVLLSKFEKPRHIGTIYTGFNFYKALDKEVQSLPLAQIIEKPPDFLHGISGAAAMDLHRIGIATLKDLAYYKPYLCAKGIVRMAKYEE